MSQHTGVICLQIKIPGPVGVEFLRPAGKGDAVLGLKSAGEKAPGGDGVTSAGKRTPAKALTGIRDLPEIQLRAGKDNRQKTSPSIKMFIYNPALSLYRRFLTDR